MVEKKTNLLKKTSKHDQDISSLESERKPFDQKITDLQAEIDGDLSESEFKDKKLSLEYLELKNKKIEAKIEKLENEKINIDAELKEIEKQIAIFECIIDHYQIVKDAENWQNRKERAVERIRKVIEERESFDIMRTNLNARWNELTTEPKEKIPSAVSPYRQDTPIKLDELCERLPLKADAKNYFI